MAARDSVAAWTFPPALHGGQRVVVPVDFTLSDAPAVPWKTAAVSLLAGVLGALGAAVGLGAFIGSLVLAKRQSVAWLWMLVALWVVAYPVFLVRHGRLAWRNAAWVLLAVALMVAGWWLAPAS